MDDIIGAALSSDGIWYLRKNWIPELDSVPVRASYRIPDSMIALNYFKSI